MTRPAMAFQRIRRERRVVKRVRDWTVRYGALVCPQSADTMDEIVPISFGRVQGILVGSVSMLKTPRRKRDA